MVGLCEKASLCTKIDLRIAHTDVLSFFSGKLQKNQLPSYHADQTRMECTFMILKCHIHFAMNSFMNFFNKHLGKIGEDDFDFICVHL